MKVAIVGGTGTVGRLVVEELLAKGDEVRIISRNPVDALTPGASHRRGDLSTGEGLSEGLEGSEVVIDASNSIRQAEEVLVEGTRRLLEAGRAAGVRHHLTVSIVGCDEVPLNYYRAKVAQEQAVQSGGIPWSVLRATQFHGQLAKLFVGAGRFRILPTGKAQFQPIDPACVATRLALAAHADPGGRLPDIAGPETLTLTELAHLWRRAKGGLLLPVRLPSITGLGRSLRDGGLCNPSVATPGPTFGQWLGDG